MKNVRLASQINILLTVTLFIPIALVAFFSIIYFTNKIQNEAIGKIYSDLKVAELIFQNRIKEIENLTNIYSQKNAISVLLSTNSLDQLNTIISKSAKIDKLDMITIVEPSLKVLSRSYTSAREDFITSSAFTDKAFDGKIVSSIEVLTKADLIKGKYPNVESLLKNKNRLLSITSAAPLYNAEYTNIIACIIIRSFLNYDRKLLISINENLNLATILFDRIIPLLSIPEDLAGNGFKIPSIEMLNDVLSKNDKQHLACFSKDGNISAAIPIRDIHNQPIGVLALQAKVDDYLRTRNITILTTVCIFLIMFILFLFIKRTINARVIRPITRLKEGTIKISQGDYKYQLKVKSKDEIGELTYAFNRMANDLFNYNQEVQEYNRLLEERVKERTDELRKSEELYKGLYVSSREGILFMDMSFNIGQANPALEEMTGYTLSELRQKSFKSLILSKWDEDNLRGQIMNNGFSEEYERDMFTKKGAVIPIIFRAWLIKNSQQNATGVWAIIRNISERKRMERMKEDVERMIRHDLKTPLNGIFALAKRLKGAEINPSQLNEYYQHIFESAKQMRYLIEHSLDLYHIETGTYMLKPEPVDLVKMLKRIKNDLLDIINEKAVTLCFNIQDFPLLWEMNFTLSGEEPLLRNMFSNLIKNAIEASPYEQKVTFSIKENKDYNQIIIHNFGVIPEPIREHFFTRYTTLGKKGGTGLGVYSALLIAKLHGGDITFKTSDDEGTFIFVTLPHSNFTPVKKEQKHKVRLTSTIPLKILLAEDNLNNQMIIQMHMENMPWELETVNNGHEAFESFKTKTFDLILMDIHMPVMDGLAAVKAIRKYETEKKVTTEIPIIALTADSSMEMHNKCLQIGFTSFIPKPLDDDTKLWDIVEYTIKTIEKQKQKSKK